MKRISLDVPDDLYAYLLEDARLNETSLKGAALKGIIERRYWQELRRTGAKVTVTEPSGETFQLQVLI